MSRAKPALITFDVLKSYYSDKKTDDEITELLEMLQSSEEIIGLEPEALALVEYGANLKPFHARKADDMPSAIPTAVAENAALVIQNAIDNLTAIQGRIVEMTEGADGAPDEIGAGLGEEIIATLQGEADNVLGLLAETPVDEGDGDPDAEPDDVDKGDEPDAEPDDVAAAEGDPLPDEGGAAADGLLGQLAQEKKDLLVDAMNRVMAGISDGSMPADDARTALYSIIDALYEMTSDVGLLALAKAVEAIEASDGKGGAEALSAVAKLNKRIDGVEQASMHMLKAVKKIAETVDNN